MRHLLASFSGNGSTPRRGGDFFCCDNWRVKLIISKSINILLFSFNIAPLVLEVCKECFDMVWRGVLMMWEWMSIILVLIMVRVIQFK